MTRERLTCARWAAEFPAGDFEEWLQAHEVVRPLAERLPANKLYRMRQTGQIVHLLAYDEDFTVRVYIIPGFSGPITGNCEVFGVRPEDLVEASEADLDERWEKFSRFANTWL